jgi:hypothetical protein
MSWLHSCAPRVGYPHRQQVRRLFRACVALAASATAALLALRLAATGAFSLAGLLVVVAAGLAFSARHWLVLAQRSRVGARSEDEVRRALAPLRDEGWRVRYSLQWRARGDIDLVAIAPCGVGFAIEVKTSRYEDRHLVVVRDQAAWLWRFRRRWRRHGVVPVLCVARRRGVQHWDDGVLVISIDRLVPALHATSYPVESVALPF